MEDSKRSPKRNRHTGGKVTAGAVILALLLAGGHFGLGIGREGGGLLTGQALETAQEKAAETVEQVQEKAQEAVETVQEKVQEVAERYMREALKEASGAAAIKDGAVVETLPPLSLTVYRIR